MILRGFFVFYIERGGGGDYAANEDPGQFHW